jgi:hypothetical protein
MSFQTPLTIKEAIENIENNKFLLPSIQREFVWEHTKIEWLFDSLMRNYPISSFLLWQVESEVKKGYKFYKFISKYREKFKTHNSEISVDGINEFDIIEMLEKASSTTAPKSLISLKSKTERFSTVCEKSDMQKIVSDFLSK